MMIRGFSLIIWNFSDIPSPPGKGRLSLRTLLLASPPRLGDFSRFLSWAAHGWPAGLTQTRFHPPPEHLFRTITLPKLRCLPTAIFAVTRGPSSLTEMLFACAPKWPNPLSPSGGRSPYSWSKVPSSRVSYLWGERPKKSLTPPPSSAVLLVVIQVSVVGEYAGTALPPPQLHSWPAPLFLLIL